MASVGKTVYDAESGRSDPNVIQKASSTFPEPNARPVMRRFTTRFAIQAILPLAVWATSAFCTDARAGEEDWIVLVGGKDFEAWKNPHGWQYVGAVKLDDKDAKRFDVEPGEGIIYNGPTGRTSNLITKDQFQDVEVHLEFNIPKGSNSGIKLEGLYEIQIMDSHGLKTLKGKDCGGIYPRAELLPKYHYLDDGHAPLVNACKPAGEWQTLDLIFYAPRFDSTGKKIKNARFDKVLLNGRLIHDNVELEFPTGHAWRKQPETATGPILLQADHGPSAFRNVKVKRLKSTGKE